jgi:hypothetical protein
MDVLERHRAFCDDYHLGAYRASGKNRGGQSAYHSANLIYSLTLRTRERFGGESSPWRSHRQIFRLVRNVELLIQILKTI